MIEDNILVYVYTRKSISELRSERGMSFQIWGQCTRREKEYMGDV